MNIPLFFRIGDSEDIYMLYEDLDETLSTVNISNGYQQLQMTFNNTDELIYWGRGYVSFIDKEDIFKVS